MHLLKIIILYTLPYLYYCNAAAQLVISLNTVPENTPPSDNIYITGSFNNWDADNSQYLMNNNGDGSYYIVLDPAPGIVEYKFTRGSWATVEGDENGNFIPNHAVNYNGQQMNVDVAVISWEDLGGNSNNSTATENVTIISESFYMPELERDRRIWIYLPPDYATSNNTYPTLYMHDAQNVFDVTTSFSGEWEVDESLDALFNDGDGGLIVIGIDNGGAERINEYCPWENATYGGGDGAAYINFIVNTLKPHIDENYRTLAGREHTGIMGSSLGGLISLYAAIEHQDVFSKAGIFSPAFWINPEVYDYVNTVGYEDYVKFYFIAGDQEDSGSVVQAMQTMHQSLSEAGFGSNLLQCLNHQDGQHSEWYWKREFPEAYLWLYNDASSGTGYPAFYNINLYPNPTKQLLYIDVKGLPKDASVQLYSSTGQLLLQKNMLHHSITVDLTQVPEGVCYFQLLSGNSPVYINRLFVYK